MAKLKLFIAYLFLTSPVFSAGSRSFTNAAGENLSGGAINQVTTGNFTIYAWAKMTEDATVDAVVGKARSLSVNFAGYGMYQDAADNYNIKVYDGAVALSCASGRDFDGSWIHLWGRWNGTSNSLSLYENGTLACSPATTAVGSLTNGFNFEVGNAGTNAEPANGLIAFPGFVASVLTDNQLQELRYKPETTFPGISGHTSWGAWGQSASSERYFQGGTNLTVTTTGLSSDGPPSMIGGGIL